MTVRGSARGPTAAPNQSLELNSRLCSACHHPRRRDTLFPLQLLFLISRLSTVGPDPNSVVLSQPVAISFIIGATWGHRVVFTAWGRGEKTPPGHGCPVVEASGSSGVVPSL